MKRMYSFGSMLALVAAALGAPAASAQVSGAIYTSLSNGSEVNFNIYASKFDVYLNGGPGKGAGSNAPGLSPDGVYVFMVTSPDGQMLSTDIAACRFVRVVNGVIAGRYDEPTVPCPVPHVNGSLQGEGAIAVQLMPYNDTPNPGGEYKAWLTPRQQYVCDWDVVTCDAGRNGFINSQSKTDNFKVGSFPHEIDTRFWDQAGNILDGRMITWYDTHGASNRKWSYYAPEIVVMHEAHVEAPEIGTHYIAIPDQPGCKVGDVYLAGAKTRKSGPQTVPVRITKGMLNRGSFTIFIDVICTSTN